MTVAPPTIEELRDHPLDPDLIGKRIDELSEVIVFYRRLLIAAHHLRAISNRRNAPAEPGGVRA